MVFAEFIIKQVKLTVNCECLFQNVMQKWSETEHLFLIKKVEARFCDKKLKAH